jgi:hypothetical protein
MPASIIREEEMRVDGFAIGASLVVATFDLAIAFPLWWESGQGEVVTQIRNVNAFHQQTLPTEKEVVLELTELRYTYGLSINKSRELLLTAARSGLDWEHQKQLAHIAVGLAALDKGCGGKC